MKGIKKQWVVKWVPWVDVAVADDSNSEHRMDDQLGYSQTKGDRMCGLLDSFSSHIYTTQVLFIRRYI